MFYVDETESWLSGDGKILFLKVVIKVGQTRAVDWLSKNVYLHTQNVQGKKAPYIYYILL